MIRKLSVVGQIWGTSVTGWWGMLCLNCSISPSPTSSSCSWLTYAGVLRGTLPPTQTVNRSSWNKSNTADSIPQDRISQCVAKLYQRNVVHRHRYNNNCCFCCRCLLLLWLIVFQNAFFSPFFRLRLLLLSSWSPSFISPFIMHTQTESKKPSHFNTL